EGKAEWQLQPPVGAVAQWPKPFGLAVATKAQFGGVVEHQETLAPRLVAEVEVRLANRREGDSRTGEKLINRLGVGPVRADARDAGSRIRGHVGGEVNQSPGAANVAEASGAEMQASPLAGVADEPVHRRHRQGGMARGPH